MRITERDFEYLVETSMIWDKKEWADQLEDRFDLNPPENGFIYWVENYPSLMLCRQFCEDRGYDFKSSYDQNMDQWVFISNYAATWMVSNA